MHDDLNFEPNYLVTLDEIYHSHWVARKRRRMRMIRKAVAHFWPQGHPTKLIHIAGTNGKGSTAHYLAQGLGLKGKTGSWTGPHVFDYAERFHVNGQVADHAEISQIYQQILVPFHDDFCEEHQGFSFTFAELGILLALHLFARHELDWAVLETGAGGRYSPLMGLDVEACVVTNVHEDHPRSLGTELWQRVLAKAGIARPNVPLFSAARGEALPLLRKAVAEASAPFFWVDDEMVAAVGDDSQPWFSRMNKALAIQLIQHFDADADAAALASAMTARLPVRFWQVEDGVIADVAHNVEKVAALAEELRLRYPERDVHFVLGLTRGRDALEVFAPVLKLAKRVTITTASYAGRDPQELADLLASRAPDVAIDVIADGREAYKRALALRGEQGLVVLTGSAYMIDQTLNPNPYIRHTNSSYGWRYQIETPGDLGATVKR